MAGPVSAAGLRPAFPSPPPEPGISTGIDTVTTEEAAVRAPQGAALPVRLLVETGAKVAQGAPLACLREAPHICLVAPIAGQVAKISLLPGRRLSEILLFGDPLGAVTWHDPQQGDTRAGLRRLMQGAGVWPWLQRRPFGGLPPAEETPAAIMVMATDTRPFAPDPRRALAGREDDFARGLAALARLSDGPVLLAQQEGPPLARATAETPRIHVLRGGKRHPQGTPGFCIHRHFPAGLATPVWDIHAEDTAALGALLRTGVLPMTRLVQIAGAGLRKARLLRTHPGADLRQLTRRIAAPGPHELFSGGPLDGQAARWLGQRHRQVTVLPRAPAPAPPHWLIAALTRSAGARPGDPHRSADPSLWCRASRHRLHPRPWCRR